MWGYNNKKNDFIHYNSVSVGMFPFLTFGTNMQQRATVALRLTLKHMVMIL